MQKILEKCFTFSLLISVGLGFLMIVMQMIGLLIGNGELMIQSTDWLKQPTIIFAAVFSGIAFILGYFPKYQVNKKK